MSKPHLSVRRREGRLAPETVAALNADLAARFGNRFTASEAIRRQHGHTLTWLENQPPDAVVFAETRDDVIDLVKLSVKHDAPIVPFGTGSSLEGHVNAPHGGVSLDVSRMKAILAVNADDLDCVVEPGVTPVAKPPEAIVAGAAEELHVAELVTFWEVLLLYSAVAVNCCVAPTWTEAEGGLTVIDVSTGVVTVRVVVPVTPLTAAVMVTEPTATPVANPGVD